MSRSVAFEGEPIILGEAVLLDMPTEFDMTKQELMTDATLRSAVKRMGAGSLLLAKSELCLLGNADLTGNFVEDPELGYGREKSGREVYFGQMVLSSSEDYERPELVAMKPYAQDIDGVIHELAVNTYINLVNEYPRAFQPLGIYKTPAGKYELITIYDHPVITYDNTFGANKDEEPRALEPEVVKKALRMGAFGVGLTHGHGFSNSDVQTQNLGSDNKSVRLVDLEYARFFPNEAAGGTIDVELTRSLVFRDIEVFVGSCFRIPENTIEIRNAMSVGTIDGMARSYRNGVKRVIRPDGVQYPRQARPTLSDLSKLIAECAQKAIDKNLGDM